MYTASIEKHSTPFSPYFRSTYLFSTVSDYFAYASFRLPKFAYAFFVSPTENHPSMIMFLFIENMNILSSGDVCDKKHNVRILNASAKYS